MENHFSATSRPSATPADQFDQLVDKVLLGHQDMKGFAAVLHARLQDGQRVHNHLVVLAGILGETLANGAHGIAGRVRGFVDHVADLHVGGPVLRGQVGIGGGL